MFVMIETVIDARQFPDWKRTSNRLRKNLQGPMRKFGRHLAAKVRQFMRGGKISAIPRLSKSTTTIKGSSRAFHETGMLMNSIGHEVTPGTSDVYVTIRVGILHDRLHHGVSGKGRITMSALMNRLQGGAMWEPTQRQRIAVHIRARRRNSKWQPTYRKVWVQPPRPIYHLVVNDPKVKAYFMRQMRVAIHRTLKSMGGGLAGLSQLEAAGGRVV